MGHVCVCLCRDEDSINHQLKLSYINMAIRPYTDAQSINKNKQIKVHLRGKAKLVTLNMFMCECVVHMLPYFYVSYEHCLKNSQKKLTNFWEFPNFVCIQLTKTTENMCICICCSVGGCVCMCKCVCLQDYE